MSAQRNPSRHSAPSVRRHTSRRAGWAGNGWLARVAGNVVFPLLALAVLGVLASAASCATSATTSSGAGATTGTTDITVTMTASVSGDAWIPLRSQAPDDILTAARSGPLFQDSASGGDGPDLSRLGTPVLVQALRPAGVTAEELPDFYVVPVLNVAGDATDAVELALNSAHTAVQEVAIVTYTTPRTGGAISALTQEQAIQMVASQRQVAETTLGHTSLVYFALDPQRQTSDSSQSGWTAGGALPADPIWLVPAASGGLYVAGNDGTVYTVDQLPQAGP